MGGTQKPWNDSPFQGTVGQPRKAHKRVHVNDSSSFIQTVTVGFGIAPNHAYHARGLYRQSGISPCPEDTLFSCQINYRLLFLTFQDSLYISETFRKYPFYTDSSFS